MNNKYNSYQHPLSTRYASKEMLRLFSEKEKIKIWRQLWIALAEEEKSLGLTISDDQIKELKDFAEEINWETAEAHEKVIRHDVMSHIHAYAQQASEGGKILHLGATSAFITDNTDLIQIKKATAYLINALSKVIESLSTFVDTYKELPTVGFTHFQVAQPTTVGKRAAFWLTDLMFDFNQLINIYQDLKFRGAKGTVGSQDSYLALFNGNHELVSKLDDQLAKRFDFKESFKITGQTYTRRQDVWVISTLAGLASSLSKMSYDLRLLQHLGEVEEGVREEQVGSSAMPHKRNPIRSERISGLSRYLWNLQNSMVETHATQWLERSLDDSSTRRFVIPEAFLTADALLRLAYTLINELKVNTEIIKANFVRELPILLMERIMMEASLKGEGRGVWHEKLRKMAFESKEIYQNTGSKEKRNEFLLNDAEFMSYFNRNSEGQWMSILIGRSKELVLEFLANDVKNSLMRGSDIIFSFNKHHLENLEKVEI